MTRIFTIKPHRLFFLMLISISFIGCKETLEDTHYSGSSNAFNIGGVNFTPECVEAFSFSKVINIYYDTIHPNNTKQITINLSGYADDTTLSGILVGTFTLTYMGANSLVYSYGSGGNKVDDFAESGKVKITSIANKKVSGSFDCLLKNSGSHLTGFIQDIPLY